MSFTVIDKKTESHDYGHWPLKESVTTTIMLLNMGGGQIGVSYDSDFSGLKSGHVQGGPIAIEGNEGIIVNDSPKVTVVISQFNKTANYISVHIAITVEIPVIGSETIYDQTLGGYYDSKTGWGLAIGNIKIKEPKS